MGKGGGRETERGKKLKSIPIQVYKLREAARLGSTLRLGVATAAAAAKHDGVEMIGLHSDSLWLSEMLTKGASSNPPPIVKNGHMSYIQSEESNFQDAN